MPDNLSPSQILAEVKLDRSLADYVAEKRSAVPHWSWALIASQLSTDTGGTVTVSGETIRSWYADPEVAA